MESIVINCNIKVDFAGFDTKIIDVKMVMVNKSILGKKKQASVFVVTGNKKGVLGKVSEIKLHRNLISILDIAIILIF